MTQVVDPGVSRAKFAREVARYRAAERVFVARGWWLMHAEFPTVKVALVTPNMRPALVALTALFDFTDFDMLPLSVRLVDPFTDAEIPGEQLMTRMPRLVPGAAPEAVEAARAAGIPPPSQELIQHYPGQPGFLCLPGVREYHMHPAHTGDPWELHRHTGRGSLINILEQIWHYGSAPPRALQFSIGMGIQSQEIPA